MQKKIDSNLFVFDLETTSADVSTAKICQFAVILLGKPDDDGNRPTLSITSHMVNPGVPIEPGATAVHGITDEMVRDLPAFAEYAPKMVELMQDAVFAGFNIKRFDLPVLEREMRNCGYDVDYGDRPVLDGLAIFFKHNPRDLTAAYKQYVGKQLENAHDALADTEATAEVLLAMLRQHEDIPFDAADLREYQWPRDPSWVDSTGKFQWKDGKVVIGFGSKAGQSLQQIALRDPGFLRWMLEKNFPEDAKAIARDALQNKFPLTPNMEK